MGKIISNYGEFLGKYFMYKGSKVVVRSMAAKDFPDVELTDVNTRVSTYIDWDEFKEFIDNNSVVE